MPHVPPRRPTRSFEAARAVARKGMAVRVSFSIYPARAANSEVRPRFWAGGSLK